MQEPEKNTERLTLRRKSYGYQTFTGPQKSAGSQSQQLRKKPGCQSNALLSGGLYLAGRCISGDFISMASYRVTGSAVAMGEAVGRAAARAAAVVL